MCLILQLHGQAHMGLPGGHDLFDDGGTDFGDEHQLAQIAGAAGLEINAATHHIHLHPAFPFDLARKLGPEINS